MSGKVVTPGRVGGLSGLMAECGAQAVAYGKCVASGVTGKVELQRGACEKEFQELKRCITKAAKRKTR